MPCPHCGEKINICPHCEYGMYDDESSEEFEKCPKCGAAIDRCGYCGRSLDYRPARTTEGNKAQKIIGYIAIFLIILGVMYLMYYEYILGLR